MLKRIASLWLALFVTTVCAYAATLLPNGEQVFFDNNGQVLSGGMVYFYIPNTTTLKSTYQNSTQTISNTNPVILDSAGRAIIYGSGQYRERVLDANGNLIWDQVTADTSASSYSWANVSAGTANVQTVTAPNFTSGDGQQIGFIAGLSNTSSFSLVPNSGAPINVVKFTSTGPQSLSAGDIVTGNQYLVTYSATNGNFQLVSYPGSATTSISNVTGLGTGVATALSNAANGTGGFITYRNPVVTTYSSGAGTYATPTGAVYLEVEMVGGGSGGGGGGVGTSGGAGGAGGTTAFGSLVAAGGAATPASGSTASPGSATATGGDLNIKGAIGQAGSYVNGSNWYGGGGLGASSAYGGGGSGAWLVQSGVAGSAVSGQAPGSGGGGGAPTSSGVAGNPGFGGNAGAFLKAIIISPSSSYSYSVGAAGAAGAAGTNGSAGAAGAAGSIRITAKFQ